MGGKGEKWAGPLAACRQVVPGTCAPTVCVSVLGLSSDAEGTGGRKKPKGSWKRNTTEAANPILGF